MDVARRVLRLGIAAMVVLVGLALAGAAYQVIAQARDAAAFPPPGELVPVGGHHLHVLCVGEGTPTVVLDAAAGSFSLSWARVQEGLAAVTRVCAYDRAGFGWSEVGPLPRDAERLADELHAWLEHLGEDELVLVGHSFGAFVVRVYAARHPERVAGMVLVDGSHPDQEPRFPPEVREARQAGLALMRACQVASAIGLVRLVEGLGLVDNVSQAAAAYPEPLQEPFTALALRSAHCRAIHDELVTLDASAAQAAALRSLGDRPLVVLAALGDKAGALRSAWQELQSDLPRLSSKSRYVASEDLSHDMPLEHDEIVVDAIRETVDEVRGASAPPS